MHPLKLFLAAMLATCLPPAALQAQDQPAPAALPVAAAANDTARFLAGLPPLQDPALTELTRASSWQHQAQVFDTAWASLETRQLAKVREWVSTQTPDAATYKGNVFYMFSGPDFLYANTFYPQASTYVLCGIEPIGPLPDLSKLSPDVLEGGLHALHSSLDSVLSFSFFITREMKDDFKNHALSGTLPVLYIFLARSGMTITDVSYVGVDENGTLDTQPDLTHAAQAGAPGVRIRFVKEGSGVQRSLYYFSTDISNDGLKHTGFLKFCKTLAPADSFVKSASYLMHENDFSSIRDFLLENTGTLVQDDSGIPCSFFTPEAWRVSVFGSYPGPIALFKKYTQPKLAGYYKTTNPQPLGFGIGYRHRANESTLMVATRKPQSPDAQASTPEPSKTPLRALTVTEEEAKQPVQ